MAVMMMIMITSKQNASGKSNLKNESERELVEDAFYNDVTLYHLGKNYFEQSPPLGS
jgi:hypothetical protein